MAAAVTPTSCPVVKIFTEFKNTKHHVLIIISSYLNIEELKVLGNPKDNLGILFSEAYEVALRGDRTCRVALDLIFYSQFASIISKSALRGVFRPHASSLSSVLKEAISQREEGATRLFLESGASPNEAMLIQAIQWKFSDNTIEKFLKTIKITKAIAFVGIKEGCVLIVKKFYTKSNPPVRKLFDDALLLKDRSEGHMEVAEYLYSFFKPKGIDQRVAGGTEAQFAIVTSALAQEPQDKF